MVRVGVLAVAVLVAVQVIRAQEGEEEASSRWYHGQGVGHQSWNNGFNRPVYPGPGGPGFYPQQPGFVGGGFVPNGGFSSGSGGSSFGNSMNTPWFNSHNSGSNYYSYANSLFGAFSSFSQSWSAGMSSRKQGAEKTSALIDVAAKAITQVGGKVGEHCLLRVLCESAVNNQRFTKFSPIVGDFVKSVGEEVPQDLKTLVKAFNFGQGKSLQSCARHFASCKSAPSLLLSEVNGLQF